MFFGIGNRLRVSFISPGSLLVANLRSAAALDLLARISFVLFGIISWAVSHQSFLSGSITFKP